MGKVNHPNYYNWFDIECIDVIEHFNYNLGASIKYIWRNGRKDARDQITDLRKSIWYLEREIDILQHKEKL